MVEHEPETFLNQFSHKGETQSGVQLDTPSHAFLDVLRSFLFSCTSRYHDHCSDCQIKVHVKGSHITQPNGDHHQTDRYRRTRGRAAPGSIDTWQDCCDVYD